MNFERCDLLERALDIQAADKQAQEAQAAVDNEADLRTRLETVSGERAAFNGRRSAITVPIPSALVPMRRLNTELAAARGALDVGFVVTVTPKVASICGSKRMGRNSIRRQPPNRSISKPTPRLRSPSPTSRRCASEAAVARHKRRPRAWRIGGDREVEPHLIAAGVTDLEGLNAKIAEAQELDSRIRAKDAELDSLRAQINVLSGAAEALREASDRAAASRASLGDAKLDTLAADLKALGVDRDRRITKTAATVVKRGRGGAQIADQATNDRILTDERTRHSRWLWNGHRRAGCRAGGLSGGSGCGIDCRTGRSRRRYR